MTKLLLGVSYISPEVEELYKKAGVQEKGSSGFDLVNAEDVVLSVEQPFQLINLGVRIKPPAGFHSILIARSSTFKKFHMIQANSLGLVDESYCGKEDIWRLPVIYIPTETEDIPDVTIPKGTRICQFFIQPKYVFDTYEYIPVNESRGGFGSTGH